MTWKSGSTRLEQLECPRGARVVERHERVVEHERRPAVAGDEPDEPEPRDEVDDVEGALAERADRDPVVLLGRVDLDVERLVVDPDPPVATVGHDRQVARPCAPRGSGSRSSSSPARPGRSRRAWPRRPAGDAGGGQLLAPGGQPLGLPGDLLGVDGVGLDPGPGVGLVVAGTFEGGLVVAHLDLEPLAGARLLGDRPERLERARLLRDLERGGVARARRACPVGSLPTRPSSWAFSRSIWATWASSRASRASAVGEIRQADRSELAARLGLGVLELGLHVRPAAQPPVDLDVAHLGLHLVAPPQPQRDAREDQPDDRDDARR